MYENSTGTVPQPSLVDPDAIVTEVLLVRHGRSADVVPGSEEARDPALHPEGIRQAQALAARLAAKRLDAIYSSQLKRAIDTAAALAAPRDLDVLIDPDLQEVLLGDWSNGEFRRRASLRDPAWLAVVSSGRWDGIPNGEPDATLRTRVTKALERVVARHRGGCVAVVAHSGTINACVAGILGYERTMSFTIENTSVTTIRFLDWGAMIAGVNDCGHLYDPLLA